MTSRHQDTPDKAPESLLSTHELAVACGLRTCIVERLVRLEVITPAQRGTRPAFRTHTVYRLRKMRRLHVELGVSWTSMPLVMELLERIEALERG